VVIGPAATRRCPANLCSKWKRTRPLTHLLEACRCLRTGADGFKGDDGVSFGGFRGGLDRP
jgi:hypothetical protein